MVEQILVLMSSTWEKDHSADADEVGNVTTAL